MLHVATNEAEKTATSDSAFVLLLHQEDDDVAVALHDLQPGVHPGRAARGGKRFAIPVSEPLSAGHKVALRDMEAGQPVRKSGMSIGIATTDIAAGSHVHVHNLSSALWNKSS